MTWVPRLLYRYHSDPLFDNRYSATDQQCYYDQAVLYFNDFDARSGLTDTQNVIVHTIGINTDSDGCRCSLL